MSVIDARSLCSGLLLISLSTGAYDIPVVAARAVNPEAKPANAEKPQSMPDTLLMQPGVNQLVPVAIHHLNWLVTPFEDPSVTTSSAATTEIRQNVIYVSTENEAPITLFITEKGEEGKALSLTIVPQRIPPREITLTVANQAAKWPPSSRKKAQQWEQGQPYVLTIRNLMHQLASGELPAGYSLVERASGPVPVLCQQPGLAFDFSSKQQLLGHQFLVRIGVIKNTTTQPIEFKESSCGGWDVAAVAAWPKTVLLASDRSEVYVVQKQHHHQSPTEKRSSLLRSGR